MICICHPYTYSIWWCVLWWAKIQLKKIVKYRKQCILCISVYIAWSCLCYIFYFSYDFYLMLLPQLPTFLTREREIIWWNLNTLCWGHTNQLKCQLTMLSSHSWAFSLVLKYVQGLYPSIMTFFFFTQASWDSGPNFNFLLLYLYCQAQCLIIICSYKYL